MYMRRLFKRMAAAVLVSACLVSLSACSKTEEETESLSISMDGTPVEDAMGQSLLLSAAQTLGASDEQLVVQGKLAQSQGDTVSAELYQAQLDVREEMGALRSVDIEDGSVVLLEDGSYTVILPVELIFHKLIKALYIFRFRSCCYALCLLKNPFFQIIL